MGNPGPWSKPTREEGRGDPKGPKISTRKKGPVCAWWGRGFSGQGVAWLTNSILWVIAPSPGKGFPCFELCYLLEGTHRCLSSTLGLHDFESPKKCGLTHLPTLGRWRLGQGDPFWSPRRLPRSNNKAQTGWPGAARGHQAGTMVGISRLCKPAVTWTGGPHS